MPLNQVKIRNLVNPYLNLADIWHPALHITQVPSGPVQSWPVLPLPRHPAAIAAAFPSWT